MKTTKQLIESLEKVTGRKVSLKENEQFDYSEDAYKKLRALDNEGISRDQYTKRKGMNPTEKEINDAVRFFDIDVEGVIEEKVKFKEGKSLGEILKEKKVQVILYYNTTEENTNALKISLEKNYEIYGSVMKDQVAIITTFSYLPLVDSIFKKLGIDILGVKIVDNVSGRV